MFQKISSVLSAEKESLDKDMGREVREIDIIGESSLWQDTVKEDDFFIDGDMLAECNISAL